MSSPGCRLTVPPSGAEAACVDRTVQDLLEAQRRALGREIHDAIGGALTAVHFDLAALARQPSRDAESDVRLAAAQAALQVAIEATRHTVARLYPPDLDDGLATALDRLVADFGRRTGIAADFDATGAIDLDAPRQLAVFRTAQESLTNAARHARCARVRLTLRGAPGEDGGREVVLEIRDDGSGFSTAAAAGRSDAFGLRGMAERAGAVGGRFDIESEPGRGTSVTLTLPMRGVPQRRKTG